MTRILAGLIFAALMGCTPKGAEPPVLTPTATYRDPSAQIASQTNVTADRMAGQWVIRQSVPGLFAVGQKIEIVAFASGALQLSRPTSPCIDRVCGDDNKPRILLNATGPGSWTPVDPVAGQIEDEIWVMWMDFDTRTAAIGTPSGEFGWIMDKSASGGADRITAARDIMDWFGYDLEQLVGKTR